MTFPSYLFILSPSGVLPLEGLLTFWAKNELTLAALVLAIALVAGVCTWAMLACILLTGVLLLIVFVAVILIEDIFQFLLCAEFIITR
jgi:membrane protein YdbS with pleckstrin-like domain